MISNLPSVTRNMSVLFSTVLAALCGLTTLSLRADVPAPVIRQFLPPDTNGVVLLRWDATPGSAYQVQTTSNLTAAVWSPVDYLVAASSSVTWRATGHAGAAGFYRLVTEAISIQGV